MGSVSRPGLMLTHQQVTQILDHARDERPVEACGLLGGREGRVEKVYPLLNTEHSPVRYVAEPQAQLDAMLEIEARDWEIVGIYHSHLNAPAHPSPTDVAMAAYPDVIHLIVSLTDDNSPVLGAFLIQDGEIETIDMVVEISERIVG